MQAERMAYEPHESMIALEWRKRKKRDHDNKATDENLSTGSQSLAATALHRA